MQRTLFSLEAIQCLQYCTEPSDSDAYCNLGLCYISLGLLEKAESAFLSALVIHPLFPPAYINLANLFLADLRPQQAIDLISSFPDSLDLSPHLLFNLSLCHLLMGNYTSGWMFYEYRLKTDQVQEHSFPTFADPITHLDDFKYSGSEPLIVWAEQGLGDAIQFSRYLLLLDSINVDYEFHCQMPILPLIRDWLKPKGKLCLLARRSDVSDKRPHCPLMSLPYHFKTTLATIPFSQPYLFAPSEAPSCLNVIRPAGGISIGVVWASNSCNKRMFSNKSISVDQLLSVLLPVANLGLCNIHSLPHSFYNRTEIS